jgi:hypothetical protein
MSKNIYSPPMKRRNTPEDSIFTSKSLYGLLECRHYQHLGLKKCQRGPFCQFVHYDLKNIKLTDMEYTKFIIDNILYDYNISIHKTKTKIDNEDKDEDKYDILKDTKFKEIIEEILKKGFSYGYSVARAQYSWHYNKFEYKDYIHDDPFATRESPSITPITTPQINRAIPREEIIKSPSRLIESSSWRNFTSSPDMNKKTINTILE